MPKLKASLQEVINCVWWFMLQIPAVGEAEAGNSLEPGKLVLQ